MFPDASFNVDAWYKASECSIFVGEEKMEFNFL